MTRVWDQSGQSGSKLLLLLALADHCDDEGVCWPGITRLAHKTRVSERQVQYNLRALEQDGELISIRQTGRTHTNRYFVAVGLPQDIIFKTLAAHPELVDKGATDCANSKGCNLAQKKGAIQRQEKVQPIAPESSLESSLESKESDAIASEPTTAKHPAIKAFREATHRYPAKSWYQKVGDVIGTNTDNVQFWRDVVHGWVGCGWNPTNVKGMLEYYQSRRIPSTTGKGNNGGSFKRSSGAAEPVDQATSLGGRIIDEFSASELADLGILERQGDKRADG